MEIAKTIFAELFLVTNMPASSMAPAPTALSKEPWLRAVFGIRSPAQ